MKLRTARGRKALKAYVNAQTPWDRQVLMLKALRWAEKAEQAAAHAATEESARAVIKAAEQRRFVANAVFPTIPARNTEDDD